MLFLPLNSFARNPSDKDIKEWLNQDNITIDSVQMIYLLGNERAYLADVKFDSSDSLIKSSLVLARPELDEAEYIVPFPPDYIITDLDHNGVSEIIYTQQQNLQDHNLITRYIVQLHDYKRFELYHVSYKEQKKCTLCLLEDIQWGFEDLNDDKIKDLSQDYVLSVQGTDPQFDLKKEVQNIYFEKSAFQTPKNRPLLSLSSIQTGLSVIDREIAIPSQEFDLSDENISCLLDFVDVRREDQITYYWVHEKLGLVTTIKQEIYPALQYRTWVNKSLDNNPKYLGNWVVIITDRKDKVLASKEFSVHENISLAQDTNTSEQTLINQD